MSPCQWIESLFELAGAQPSLVAEIAICNDIEEEPG
jgi:hypothetical protein